MSSPTFPVLGASTVVRKWCFEVNTGTSGAPIWTMIGGVTNSVFNPDTANLEDDSDMQSGGAGSQTKTAGSAAATLTLMRKVLASSGTAYDPGQEFLRTKGINQYGASNSVQMRIYEFTPGGGPRVEAYVGFFAVGWDPQGGGNTGLDSVQVTLAGQGQCATVTHPYPTTPVVPTITSVSPTALGTAGGQQVVIIGSGFTGTVSTTGVKFLSTNSPSWVVVSDSEIVATAPAHAAGTGAVVVTNATGPSTTGPTVTYA